MKLRYYLRGVGVGLILAVAVYSTIIIPRKYKMTDEEVLARARELGMVTEKDTDVDLSALSGTPAPPEGTNPPAPTGDGTPTPTPPEKNTTPEPTKDSGTPTPMEKNGTPIPSGEENPTLTPEKLPDLTPGASTVMPDVSDAPGMPTMPVAPTMPNMPTLPPEPLPQETETTGEKISITIPLGMGSESFALELQKAGLVEDAVDFDRYLMQNNYALFIKPGTYRILPGATYEEIAKQVTAN